MIFTIQVAGMEGTKNVDRQPSIMTVHPELLELYAYIFKC